MNPLATQRPNGRRYGGWAIASALTALAAAVLWGRLELGTQMRAQILGRDAEILNALALRAQTEARQADPLFDLGEPAAQYQVLLNIASLTNMIGARLFSSQGGFIAGVPTEVKETTLDAVALDRLRQQQSLTRFHSAQPRQALFLVLPDPAHPAPGTLSWVEIDVPLHLPGQTKLLGIAQFLLEGVTAEREFALLDRRLNLQGGLVFGVGAGLVIVGSAWAFRRLERANRLLAARTADLQRANQELANAAKINALGAVTAHLIHSLKNPVAGLQSFVAARQEGTLAGDGEEWREALAATRRMTSLIQQVVEVLHDREEAASFSVSLAELGGQVAAHTRTLAEGRGVRVELSFEGEATVDNREAGLLRLILANLVQNAVEASPPNGMVTLRLAATPSDLVAEVGDRGSGIPEPVRARLFEPVRSSKEGGSGIGLAISRQLASHLGAELALVSTSPAGTTFRLRLPRTPTFT